MTIRHILEDGTKLNETETAALQERFNRQRHSAESLMGELRQLRDSSVDFRADSRTLMTIPTQNIPEELRAEFAPIDERNRYVDRPPQVVLASTEDEAPWMNMTGPISLNAHAHGQVCSDIRDDVSKTLGRAFYWWLLDNEPETFCLVTNRMLERLARRRLVRTVNGHARAVLSTKYKVLDNYDLAKAIIPLILDEKSPWQIQQCGLTEKRLHIEAICPTLTTDIRVGEPVSLALKLTGSDVGSGALGVAFGTQVVACTNLMLVNEWSNRWIHLGKEQDGDMVELLSERTVRMEEQLIFRKVKDVVGAMANKERFDKFTARLRESADAKLEDPVAASEVLVNHAGLKQDEAHAVQNNLLESGDTTMWGLGNALTAAARTMEYERKAKLESVAGKLFNTPGQWRQFTEAKPEVAA